MNELRTPSDAVVCDYLEKFHGDWMIQGTDDALELLFGRFPKSHRLEEVLLKVVTLTTLYGAGLEIHRHPRRSPPHLPQARSTTVSIEAIWTLYTVSLTRLRTKNSGDITRLRRSIAASTGLGHLRSMTNTSNACSGNTQRKTGFQFFVEINS